MKTEWDYTDLADAYLKRPNYADSAIDAMLSVAGIGRGDKVCDVGAGLVLYDSTLYHWRGVVRACVEINQ